jgi:hypothetical protein
VVNEASCTLSVADLLEPRGLPLRRALERAQLGREFAWTKLPQANPLHFRLFEHLLLNLYLLFERLNVLIPCESLLLTTKLWLVWQTHQTTPLELVVKAVRLLAEGRTTSTWELLDFLERRQNCIFHLKRIFFRFFDWALVHSSSLLRHFQQIRTSLRNYI